MEVLEILVYEYKRGFKSECYKSTFHFVKHNVVLELL